MSKQTNRRPQIWSFDFGEPPAGSHGVVVQFALSRSSLDFANAELRSDDDQSAKLKNRTRHRGAVLTSNQPLPSCLRLRVPYRGARPHMKWWRWVADDAVAALGASIGQTPAMAFLNEQPTPADLLRQRLQRAQALDPYDDRKAAKMFFAELDMATNANMLGEPGSAVDQARIDLVDREITLIRERLIRLAAYEKGLAAPPGWSGANADRDAVVDIMLPLIEKHFGAGIAFDAEKLGEAFVMFAAGELIDDSDEPHIGGPDSANILCFPGFALRAISAANESPIWSDALPYMVRAAGVYFWCAEEPADYFWDSYAEPYYLPPDDLEDYYDDRDLPLGPPSQVKHGLGKLVAEQLIHQVRNEFSP